MEKLERNRVFFFTGLFFTQGYLISLKFKNSIAVLFYSSIPELFKASLKSIGGSKS